MVNGAVEVSGLVPGRQAADRGCSQSLSARVTATQIVGQGQPPRRCGIDREVRHRTRQCRSLNCVAWPGLLCVLLTSPRKLAPFERFGCLVRIAQLVCENLMKLFHANCCWRLAALDGLLAPMAATHQSSNIDGVNATPTPRASYQHPQFSDVQPTEWAYPGSLQPGGALRAAGGWLSDGTFRAQGTAEPLGSRCPLLNGLAWTGSPR